MDQDSVASDVAPAGGSTTSAASNDDKTVRSSAGGARLPGTLSEPVTAAHARVCSYIEHQAGAVKDWKTDVVSTKLPGRVFYLFERQMPIYAVCPDLAVDATAQVRMGGGAGGAALLQEPLKAGSVVQLPGGILTKVFGFIFDLRKNELSMKIILGWPTRQALSADDSELHAAGGVHVSYGSESVLPLSNGDIGLLIAVSKQPMSRKST